MGARGTTPLPFSVQILPAAPDDGADASGPDGWLHQLLPASYRTETDDLAAPGRPVETWMGRELDMNRLHRVLRWLWVAGRPVPPRALHHQLLLGRAVVVTERLDMHLVWTTGRIFVKPLPRFLLEPRVWADHLSCLEGCICREAPGAAEARDRECERRRLRKIALGLVFSYAALISHESDFHVAAERRLLPSEVTWPAWRMLVQQLDPEHIYPDIDARFVYGELRLSRLNKVYFLQRPFLRGYTPQWDQYDVFFRDSLAWLASMTIFIVVVLTAMQVGLATSLAESVAFQSASYGFTVFSILCLVVAAGLLALVFCFALVKNWMASVAYSKRRLHRIKAHVQES